jgi:hypothetical protein
LFKERDCARDVAFFSLRLSQTRQGRGFPRFVSGGAEVRQALFVEGPRRVELALSMRDNAGREAGRGAQRPRRHERRDARQLGERRFRAVPVGEPRQRTYR